jgi:hypothetical protein
VNVHDESQPDHNRIVRAPAPDPIDDPEFDYQGFFDQFIEAMWRHDPVIVFHQRLGELASAAGFADVELCHLVKGDYWDLRCRRGRMRDAGTMKMLRTGSNTSLANRGIASCPVGSWRSSWMTGWPPSSPWKLPNQPLLCRRSSTKTPYGLINAQAANLQVNVAGRVFAPCL